MITLTPESNVQRSSDMQTKTFTMQASAKGFRILSTTMYRDPILAIVREIICNAWDAQQVNKNKTAIKVHTPNALEPWFSVRDFGPGMSHDDIFGIYTTVFGSTKTESNDFIGAMGLGSKTPFSYNNGQAFTVTSIHKGKKAIYTAYMNNGMPDITCMQQPTDTDEPDGVEVQIPVAKGDYQHFLNRTTNVVAFFDNPKIETNIKLDLPQFEELKDMLISKQKRYYYGDVYALMGNVAYPISSSQIDSYHNIRDLYPGRDVYIKFDIGELDVAASREELHYDDNTKATINEKMTKISENAIKESQKWINEQNFDRIGAAYRAAKDRFSDAHVNILKFNGVNITEYPKSLNKISPKNGVVSISKESANASGIRRHSSYRFAGDILSTVRDYKSEPITIVVDDLKTGGVAITNNYVKKTGGQVFYHHDDKQSACRTLEFFKETLLDDEYIVLKTSDLKATYKPSPKTKKKFEKKTWIDVYSLDNIGNVIQKSEQLDPSSLKTDEYYYITTFNGDVTEKAGGGATFSHYASRDVIKIYCKLLGVDKVIALNPSEYRRFAEKNENAKYLFVDLKVSDIKKIDMTSYIVSNYYTYGYRTENRFLKNMYLQKLLFKPRCKKVVSLSDSYEVVNFFKKQNKFITAFDKEETRLTKEIDAVKSNNKFKLIRTLIEPGQSKDIVHELYSLIKGKRNG